MRGKWSGSAARLGVCATRAFPAFSHVVHTAGERHYYHRRRRHHQMPSSFVKIFITRDPSRTDNVLLSLSRAFMKYYFSNRARAAHLYLAADALGWADGLVASSWIVE